LSPSIQGADKGQGGNGTLVFLNFSKPVLWKSFHLPILVFATSDTVDFQGSLMLIDPENFDYRRKVTLEQPASDIPVLMQEFVVANRLGIHARVAAQIVRVASKFESEILFTKCDMTVNGKSILDLMTLVCPHGSKILISAKGRDAAEALNALAALFQTKFGEP